MCIVVVQALNCTINISKYRDKAKCCYAECLVFFFYKIKEIYEFLVYLKEDSICELLLSCYRKCCSRNK